MVSEVVLSSECLAANVTRVRSFVSMRPFMDEQIVRLCELSVAIFANKLFLRSCSGCTWDPHWWRVSSWEPLGHNARVPQGMVI